MIYRVAATNALPANDMPWGEVSRAPGRAISPLPPTAIMPTWSTRWAPASVFAWDAGAGRLTRLQTCSLLLAALPARTPARISTSSVRQVRLWHQPRHDSPAIFAIDADSGLSPPWATSRPRAEIRLAIDPSGRFLLAANQDLTRSSSSV